MIDSTSDAENATSKSRHDTIVTRACRLLDRLKKKTKKPARDGAHAGVCAHRMQQYF